LSDITRPRAFIVGIYYHLDVLFQRCSNYAAGVTILQGKGLTRPSTGKAHTKKAHFKRVPEMLNIGYLLIDILPEIGFFLYGMNRNGLLNDMDKNVWFIMLPSHIPRDLTAT